MNKPGNHELAPEELPTLLGGELPPVLPLEGWRPVTLHCQVDAIGPSDRHPDLVKLEVSFPPVQAPPVQAPPVMRAPLIGQPIQEIRLVCGTCGLVPVEEHPRILDVLRCVNCKEHLGVGRFEGST